jgi:heat shock protein HslJ
MKRIRIFEVIGVIIIMSIAVFAGISCNKAVATAKLEGFTWVLKYYGDLGNLKGVLPDKQATLIFDKDKKEISGNGGVNGYGGNYEINGSQITVSGIIHTEIASINQALNNQENTFFSILGSAQSYKLNGQELTLTGSKGLVVFFFQQ